MSIEKNFQEPIIGNPNEIEDSSESELYKSSKNNIDVIYEKYSNPEERVAEIIRLLDPFFKHIDKKILSEDRITEIRNNIETCSLAKDKNEFIEKMMKTLKPFFDIKEKNADKFEETIAKTMNEIGGFTEINRLLSYGKYKSIIHIHAPAGKTVDNKSELYRKGMKKLADIVKNDPEVKEITATSNLVAEHQRLFKKIGFKIEDVTDEFKREHFPREKREIKKASISREDFLNIFLKSN